MPFPSVASNHRANKSPQTLKKLTQRPQSVAHPDSVHRTLYHAACTYLGVHSSSDAQARQAWAAIVVAVALILL
jgi:hypothetical protein